MECIRCSDFPKATVRHAQAQELCETFNVRYDGGVNGCVTIGHNCGSSLSDLPNVGPMMQSHNSGISLCDSGSSQYRINVLGVVLPCQHIYNHESTYVTMSDTGLGSITQVIE